MTQIFSDASCPLYKFGDTMLLSKIPQEEWYRTENITTDEMIDLAIDDILEQNEFFY